MRRLTLAIAVLSIAVASAPAAHAADVRVERSFPAAGELLVRTVPVRTGPSPTARLIKRMPQFRPDFRRQTIFAVALRTGTDGKPWYRISVPMRPNGTYGWIPASAASVRPTPGKIVVDRSSRTIDLYWHGKHELNARVAVGAPGMETPIGHYFVQARFTPTDSFLGVFAVETSAYSLLSEWPGGGVVGIHGTSAPELLGQAVSHGCVRVANSTALVLRKYARLGTPIVIKD